MQQHHLTLRNRQLPAHRAPISSKAVGRDSTCRLIQHKADAQTSEMTGGYPTAPHAASHTPPLRAARRIQQADYVALIETELRRVRAAEARDRQSEQLDAAQQTARHIAMPPRRLSHVLPVCVLGAARVRGRGERNKLATPHAAQVLHRAPGRRGIDRREFGDDQSHAVQRIRIGSVKRRAEIRPHGAGVLRVLFGRHFPPAGRRRSQRAGHGERACERQRPLCLKCTAAHEPSPQSRSAVLRRAESACVRSLPATRRGVGTRRARVFTRRGRDLSGHTARAASARTLKPSISLSHASRAPPNTQTLCRLTARIWRCCRR